MSDHVQVVVSESAVGQSVTVYAVGTALTAIPLVAATAGWRRKRLLVTAMAVVAGASAHGFPARRTA